ncbi:MAG TPA: hypothetical protein VN181_14700 [Thermoanaerobaculia bacterium]|nr:hypothetical protein [Thermoanaerobaculia bacterium]
MSDGCFGMVAFISCISSILLLWSRYQQRKALRRLRQLLEESGIDVRKLEEESTPDREKPPLRRPR